VDEDGDGLPTYTYDGPLGPEATFEHGVASGDPLADAVILWTRISPGDLGDGPHEVFLEIAEDPGFTRRLAAAPHQTDAAADFTLRVDAVDLAPGQTVYYRFWSLGRVSPIGRTRTAPSDSAASLRFGVCSCSNLAFGYFHAYRHLAERPDLDAVIHLGDYIYEYASKDHGRTYGEFRELEPLHEIVSLADYRLRYSLYRRDPDLQELHRQNPFIHIWDDHEFTNDPFVGGAENHTPEDEGDWDTRVANALQAYAEWMPTRLGEGGRIYRTLVYGDRVSLLMLDRQRRFVWPDPADGDHYLGQEQTDWLMSELAKNSAQWTVLGQGTRFGSTHADGVGGASWDVDSRHAVLEACRAAGVENLVVLTGDIHKAGALDIVEDPQDDYDPTTGAGSSGVELYCNSISSPGSSDNTDDAPQYHWSEGLYRGYLVVDFSAARLAADFYGFFDLAKTLEERPIDTWLQGFQTLAGANHLTPTEAPVETRIDAPALAP